MEDKKNQIVEFLNKMANQDNRSTAFPFYYTIRTRIKVFSQDGELSYYDVNMSESYSEEQYRNYIKEMILEERLSEDESLGDVTDDDIDDRIKQNLRNGDLTESFTTDGWVERGMFLTETDAEKHLKLNHYHYSSDAHTYVNHAWRAPELTQFLKNLMDYFGVTGKNI